jgi:hypothetical protein
MLSRRVSRVLIFAAQSRYALVHRCAGGQHRPRGQLNAGAALHDLAP